MDQPSVGKKKYTAPKLTTYGSLPDLVKGAGTKTGEGTKSKV
jgi:hypothetical protein